MGMLACRSAYRVRTDRNHPMNPTTGHIFQVPRLRSGRLSPNYMGDSMVFSIREPTCNHPQLVLACIEGRFMHSEIR
jgi:hypothetical protein